MIIFGTRFYGKVDHLPGLCYVVTRFVHIWFVPLIPTETYLVLEGTESGGNFRGVPISLSGKSVVNAWLRAGCVLGILGGIIASFVSLIRLSEGRAEFMDVIGSLGVFVAAIGLMVLSYKVFGKASPQRAEELGQHLGIDPRAMADMASGVSSRRKELDEVIDANPDALGKFGRRDANRRRDEEEDSEGQDPEQIRSRSDR
jgi:hypothetical protein